jgi:hypothetical protein
MIAFELKYLLPKLEPEEISRYSAGLGAGRPLFDSRQV